MKNTLLIVVLILCFSCRKDIKLKLPNYQQKVVVEASIETGLPAFVLLSYSVPYFGNFDLTNPDNIYIKDGFVTITDGTLIDTLQKGYIPNVPVPFYFGSKVIGVQGKTYTLNLTVKNKSYTSVSTILNPPKLDSIYFKGEQDSLGYLWAHFTEPEPIGDYYQWFAKRLYKDIFYALPIASSFEDKFINGKSFEFAYSRPQQPYYIANNDNTELGKYAWGDTVIVKFCKIGQKEYEFWNSYYLNKSSNGNPFSAPSNIKSTFGNDLEVLGAFVAYSPSFDTLIIKKK